MSELQLSLSHRNRLLNSHDMVKKDIVSDVTGAAIPKLETIFCTLNHDQTQKMASRATHVASNSLEINPDHI